MGIEEEIITKLSERSSTILRNNLYSVRENPFVRGNTRILGKLLECLDHRDIEVRKAALSATKAAVIIERDDILQFSLKYFNTRAKTATKICQLLDVLAMFIVPAPQIPPDIERDYQNLLERQRRIEEDKARANILIEELEKQPVPLKNPKQRAGLRSLLAERVDSADSMRKELNTLLLAVQEVESGKLEDDVKSRGTSTIYRQF